MRGLFGLTGRVR